MVLFDLLYFLVGDWDQFSCKKLNFSSCLPQPNAGTVDAILPDGKWEWECLEARSVPLTRPQQRQSTVLISISPLPLWEAAAVLGLHSCSFPLVGCNLEIAWEIAAVVRMKEGKQLLVQRCGHRLLQHLEFGTCVIESWNMDLTSNPNADKVGLFWI